MATSCKPQRDLENDKARPAGPAASPTTAASQRKLEEQPKTSPSEEENDSIIEVVAQKAPNQDAVIGCCEYSKDILFDEFYRSNGSAIEQTAKDNCVEKGGGWTPTGCPREKMSKGCLEGSLSAPKEISWFSHMSIVQPSSCKDSFILVVP